MYDEQAMAYWHNLSWVIADRYTRAEGGLIENMEALAFDLEVAKVDVKTKKDAEVVRDIKGQIVTKGKKGKETIVTAKPQYLEPTFKQQQITCQTKYMVATGTTDILGKIEEIKAMMGSVSPLVIGCVIRDYSYKYEETGYPITSFPRVLGVYNMQLKKIKVADTEMDSAGRLLQAKVSFTFVEATDQKAIKACMAYPGDATRLMLSGWIDKVSEYTEVEDPEGNPVAQGWYEINPKWVKDPVKNPTQYVLTKDKTVVSGKTYYQPGQIPESYWSAIKVSADPTAKALVKQKTKDDKAVAKAQTADMKAKIKAAQKAMRAGTYVDDGTL